jgi:hypothetical protein
VGIEINIPTFTEEKENIFMKRFSVYVILIAASMLVSCGHRHAGETKPTLLSNFVNITDNENNGIQEIIKFYGGQCKYGLGVIISTNESKKKYFKLEITGGNVIDRYSSNSEMPASNIAYLFYRNLKDEKNNYDEIHTILIFNDGAKAINSYSKDTLEIVDRKMKVVNKVVDLLKSKNFEGIRQILNPDTAHIHYSKDELISNLSKHDTLFNNIKVIVPWGFRFDKFSDGYTKLHISAILTRDKQNCAFSVDFDPTSTKDDILLLDFKL